MAIVEDYKKIHQTERQNDTSLINMNIYAIYEFYGTANPIDLLKAKFTKLMQIWKHSKSEIDIQYLFKIERIFLTIFSYLINHGKYMSIPSISLVEDDTIDFRWLNDNYDILLNIEDDYTFTMDTDIKPGYSETVSEPLTSIFDRLLINFNKIDTSLEKTVTPIIE